MVEASACRVTDQSGVCLRRWCRRQTQMRFSAAVGPFGQGRTWSRSQNRADTRQPGKRHFLSRNFHEPLDRFRDPVPRVDVRGTGRSHHRLTGSWSTTGGTEALGDVALEEPTGLGIADDALIDHRQSGVEGTLQPLGSDECRVGATEAGDSYRRRRRRGGRDGRGLRRRRGGWRSDGLGSFVRRDGQAECRPLGDGGVQVDRDVDLVDDDRRQGIASRLTGGEIPVSRAQCGRTLLDGRPEQPRVLDRQGPGPHVERLALTELRQSPELARRRGLLSHTVGVDRCQSRPRARPQRTDGLQPSADLASPPASPRETPRATSGDEPSSSAWTIEAR